MSTLPPLPDPIHMGLEEVDWNEFVPVTGYTADQMREYARAALAQPAASGEPWRCACGANLYIDDKGAPRSKA